MSKAKKTTYHTMTTANETVVKAVLNPTEFGLTMPHSIGLNSGVAVAFAGLTFALIGATWGGIETQQFFGTAAASATLGVAVGSYQRARLGREAMRYLAEIAMKREEWEESDEPDAYPEPERPRYLPPLPSFVQDRSGYHRVMHDLARREILMLNGHAKQGERFPTRDALFSKGFTNNAQRFKELREELHAKGILINNIWTDTGVAWIREEAHLAASPTPKP